MPGSNAVVVEEQVLLVNVEPDPLDWLVVEGTGLSLTLIELQTDVSVQIISQSIGFCLPDPLHLPVDFRAI